VELGGTDEVEAFYAEVLRRTAAGEFPAARDVVPAARTVLLTGLPDPARTARELASWQVPPAAPRTGTLVRIAVRYDGPDLAEVARLWDMTPREVVATHTGTGFRVAFCGFAPGFGYLTGLGDHLRVPRREVPRTAVPAGSVALAGPYTGVYPHSSPGGWQLIGTTDAVLWDPARDPAALLAPGTRVRFTDADADAGDGADAPGDDGSGAERAAEDATDVPPSGERGAR
jgi:KipI family sensor histidine kinase inhibitor